MAVAGGQGAATEWREKEEDGRRVEKRIELFFFFSPLWIFCIYSICSTRKLYFASCRTKEWMDDFVINN